MNTGPIDRSLLNSLTPVEEGEVLGNRDGGPASAANKTPRKDRLTVTSQVSFEQPNLEPVQKALVAVASYEPNEDEPYQRRQRISDAMGWRPVDFGWLSDQPMSCVVLSNTTTLADPNVVPTDEERAYLRKQVLAVSFDGESEHCLIPPGLFMLLPSLASDVFIRAKEGTVNYHIFATPGAW